MTHQFLAKKVAIVTGAARGQGEATARLFAQAGACVALADMHDGLGEAVAQEIVQAGGRAFYMHVDVSNSQAVKALVERTVAEFGKLDIAVNNAARSPDSLPLSEFDEDDFDSVIAIDLKGVALCLKHQLAQMIKQGHGGSIINIGSTSSFRPQPNNGAYVAAKHGVIGLSKVAAIENGVHGIRVNTVAPGAIDTPMLRGALAKVGCTEADYAPQLSLLGRFGQPHEVAHASLWLASDFASYVTGSTIHVDAGYTNR